MEFEITSIRIILLLLMLGIASYFDIKTRMVPDAIWLVFGGLGAILYVFDYESVTSYHFLAMIMGGFASFMIWRWRLAGIADTFAVLAMTVILPVYYEFVMIPIFIPVIVFFLMIILVMMYNISLNLSDMIRSRKIIFSEFKSESKYKKAFAFLSTHRKRRFERFVISVEDSMSIAPNVKSFVFLSSSRFQRNNQLEHTAGEKAFVQNIPSFLIFMFVIALFLLLPEIIFLIF